MGLYNSTNYLASKTFYSKKIPGNPARRYTGESIVTPISSFVCFVCFVVAHSTHRLTTRAFNRHFREPLTAHACSVGPAWREPRSSTSLQLPRRAGLSVSDITGWYRPLPFIDWMKRTRKCKGRYHDVMSSAASPSRLHLMRFAMAAVLV